MKPERKDNLLHLYYRPAGTKLAIQAPLPGFLHTLPKLVLITGPGSGRQGPSPSAPPQEPAHD